jgi:histidinol phosphatase-like PHP family hydrolase
MYNLHCHSLLSDGVLLPSEVAMRYLDKGYKTIAITDHADYSNIKSTIQAILEFTDHWPEDSKIKVLPGLELTHLPLDQFQPLAEFARGKGVKIIIAHGETSVEPILKGTNRAALKADIDILAHPGLINDRDVQLAKEKGIFLEITSRRGHAESNPHVVDQALKFSAKLILNNDSHEPADIITPEQLIYIGLKSGLNRNQIDKIYKEVEFFLKDKEG